MKCNKCYQRIKETEEMLDDGKFYHESCYKSNSWKRTTYTVFLYSGFTLFILVLIGMLCYFWLVIRKNK